MKNLLKLFSVSLMVCALVFTGCNPDDPDPKPDPKPDPNNPTAVTTPTNLNATNVAIFSAKLLWTGSADSFEYEVTGGATPITGTVTTNEVTVRLTMNTTYNWKIRAKKGNEYSNWVNGVAFTTITPTLPATPTMPTEPGVVITFGSETWTTSASAGVYSDQVNAFQIVASKTGTIQYPYVVFGGNMSVGISNLIYQAPFPFFDYYEATYLTDGVSKFGDWWALTGSITVTAINGTNISGYATVVMVHETENVGGATAEPATRTLQATFVDVNMTPEEPSAKSFKTSSSRVVK
jgi:hypothetical protein